ncbi:hypothetical protein BDV18DRAFT_127172 [Aspergillus unguis]
MRLCPHGYELAIPPFLSLTSLISTTYLSRSVTTGASTTTMTMSGFAFANSLDNVPGNGALPAEFTIKASPDTDVWAKPPSTERFSAPILYKSIPLQSFKRVRVAFSANWSQKYDQGGLILVLNGANGMRKWVKTGIELTHGKPHLSTVSKDRWADWSLRPVPSGGTGATLELVREPDDSLWVYLVEGVQKAPLREVTWVFAEEGVKDFWIGVYAARPSSDGGDLVVTFASMVIDATDSKGSSPASG